MGKGENPGMGTVIGPQDYQWYGNSGVEGGKRDDADAIDRRQAKPLTSQAEKRISDLRVDIAGLKRELAALDNARESLRGKIAKSETDLASLLHQHGLSRDSDLPPPPQPVAQANPGKTTRHQRRKRAKQRYEARKQQHD